VAAPATRKQPREPQPPRTGLVGAPQPRGETEFDSDTEWDLDWPADDDGDWSGCARDGAEDFDG
jgi:hypothetical protein